MSPEARARIVTASTAAQPADSGPARQQKTAQRNLLNSADVLQRCRPPPRSLRSSPIVTGFVATKRGPATGQPITCHQEVPQ